MKSSGYMFSSRVLDIFSTKTLIKSGIEVPTPDFIGSKLQKIKAIQDYIFPVLSLIKASR